MAIVGEASILIRPVTTGFKEALKAESAGGLSQFEKDAQIAGAGAGVNLRKGVTAETGKLASDMERDGAKGGQALSRGAGSGLSKLAGVIGATGLPLGGLSSKLDHAGKAADDTAKHSSGLAGSLSHLGGIAALGVAGGLALAGGAAIHVGESMQSAETKIAGAAGTSVASAQKIGAAFLDTGGKSEFSGVQMAQAFAPVAGQLKSTEGHALSAAEAIKVMAAASDLAAAKQIDLGTATATVAKVMQAFHLGANDAGHAADVLFNASNATGQSVDTLAQQLAKVKSKLGETGGSIGDLSALLVDMTNQGITGRGALGALNVAMTTLQKSAEGVSVAQQAQKATFDQMPPSLQKLATGLEHGTLTAKDFTKQTGGLPTQQAALAASFAKSSTAISAAQVKFKELGVTVFDAHGKFVGMGSIIDQLHPRFAHLTQQQQLAAAATIFGAGAAKQMVEVIKAGPAAYDKASGSVNRHGAAQSAAAQQAKTLHGEEATLKAEVSDLAAKVGAVLIPVITAMVGAFVKATTFVTQHKAILIGLAAVVTGVLATAISVFAVNKMAQFGQSFVTAKGHIGEFASGVQSAVDKVIGMFTKQTAASDASTATMSRNAAKGAAATEAEAAKIEGSSAAMASSTEQANARIATSTEEMAAGVEGSTASVDAAFAGVGTEADVTATDVTAKTGIMKTDIVAAEAQVATSDTAIASDNTAAGASFARVLGPLAILLTGLNQVSGFLQNHGVLPTQSGGAHGAPGIPSPNPNLPVPGSPIGGGGNIWSVLGGLFNARDTHSLAQGYQHEDKVSANFLIKTFSAAIHSGSQDKLDKALSLFPSFSITALENRLSGDHSKALAALAKKLEAVHQKALNAWSYGATKQTDKFTAAAAASATAGKTAADATLDATKVKLDQGAEVGKTGPALAAAKAQTALDKATQTGNAAINAAQAKVDKAAATAQKNTDQTAHEGEVSVNRAQAAADRASARKAAADAREQRASAHAGQVSHETGPHAKGDKAKADAELADAKRKAHAADAADKAQAAALSKAQADAARANAETGKKGALDQAKAAAELAAAQATAQTSEATAQAAKDLADATAAAADAADQAKAAAAAALDQATAAGITKASSLVTDQAKTTADQITDSTKVYLDQQAEIGKTGAALTAAQAQTAMDQTTQTANAAIDAAQAGVDQAAGGSATEQATAAALLAQAQADATVNEATAQSILDKDNALANAAGGPPPPTGGGGGGGGDQHFNFSIFGNGTLTAAQLFSEVGWALNTGALPVAAASLTHAAA